MLSLHRLRWIVGLCALAALPLGFLAIAQAQEADPDAVLEQEPFNFALHCQEQGYEPQVCIRMMAMLGEEAGNRLQTRCRQTGLTEAQCGWLMTYQHRHQANQNDDVLVVEPLRSRDRDRLCQQDCTPDRLQERDRERLSQPETPAKGRGKGG